MPVLCSPKTEERMVVAGWVQWVTPGCLAPSALTASAAQVMNKHSSHTIFLSKHLSRRAVAAVTGCGWKCRKTSPLEHSTGNEDILTIIFSSS